MNSSLLSLEKGALLLCSLPNKREEIVASLVISLTEKAPFKEVLHLPIKDYHPPSPAFDVEWLHHKAHIHALLDANETIALHCYAGLGRTGTIAAKILIERGFTPQEAISRVRETRPGSIETEAQENYLKALA
jgi:protein-tyrosine phosphatase